MKTAERIMDRLMEIPAPIMFMLAVFVGLALHIFGVRP